MNFSEEDLQQMLKHPFFKPHFLKINPDVLPMDFDRIPENQLEMAFKLMRTIVFKTASELKSLQAKMFADSLKEMPMPLNKREQTVMEFLWKLYTTGVQNGVVDYANSLIEALERYDFQSGKIK